MGRHDWAAAGAMSVGVSVFLASAAPSGGRPHASALSWWLSGLAILAVVAIVAGVGGGFGAGEGPSARRAACLGIATGIAWGFVAAVIKELSSHLAGGATAIFTTWPVYVLMAAGAAAMILTSHAMTAGPLAASQPGMTLCDPLAAITLGALVFAEHLQTTELALAGEVSGLILLGVGARALSGSPLISGR